MQEKRAFEERLMIQKQQMMKEGVRCRSAPKNKPLITKQYVDHMRNSSMQHTKVSPPTRPCPPKFVNITGNHRNQQTFGNIKDRNDSIVINSLQSSHANFMGITKTII